MTGEFLAQRASNAENVSIWCHHGLHFFCRRKRAETCLVVQTWHRPPQWPPRPRRDLDPHPSSRVHTALPRQGSRTSLYIILRRSINHLMQCWLNRLLRKWYWEFLYSFRIRFSTYVLNSSAEKIQMFLAATKQLYEWFSPSVRPSVRPSVCHTFLTMFPSSYHHEIFRSYYQWQKWRPCKR